MMTVKQVSTLTGVSVRTLQFYDEIGLFKPTKMTDAGYRLYDENAMETLQQILFFKELDFTLKEIKAIMDDPHFDQAAAFQKQRELIQIKRDRLNSLLGLLDKLIKGEKSMDFQDFDLSEYFRILSDFKRTHTNEIVERMGSMESYDDMIAEMKAHEKEIAEMAVKEFGSLENYTHAMKTNFQNFLTNGPAFTQEEAKEIVNQTDEITKRLTADLSKDVNSPEVQAITQELIAFTNACNQGIEMAPNHWSFMADYYLSNPTFIKGTDHKYGEGASRFIGLAIKAYLANA